MFIYTIPGTIRRSNINTVLEIVMKLSQALCCYCKVFKLSKTRFSIAWIDEIPGMLINL